MKKNALLKTLLLSSTLILTGCGSSNSPSDSLGPTTQADQAKLAEVQADLASLQLQEIQLVSKLIKVNEGLIEAKEDLDHYQQLFTNQRVSSGKLDEVQQKYNTLLEEQRTLQQQKVDLDYKYGKAQELAETLGAVIRRDVNIASLGTELLSGTLSFDDLHVLRSALRDETPERLLPLLNQSLADIKKGLGTGAALKSNLETTLNSPIIEQLAIPLGAMMIQQRLENGYKKAVSENRDFWEGFEKVSGKKISDKAYSMDFKLSEVVALVESENKDNMSETAANIVDILIKSFEENFVAYVRYNTAIAQETIKIDIDLDNPNALQSTLSQTVIKFKPYVVDFLKKAPAEFLNGVVGAIAGLKDFNEDDFSQNDSGALGRMLIARDFLDAVLPDLTASQLSARAPLSSSSTTAYRQARVGTGGVGLQQLAIDGNALDHTYAAGIPLRMDLKGDVNTASRTADMVGSVSYNMNGTVIGLIQGFGNMNNRHYETSLLLSQSLGGFFIEGQAGFVGVREGLFSGWEGQRYQATLGYDAAYVSPFIQVEYRPLANGLSTLDAMGAYVGLETDVLKVKQAEATFTSKVLMKLGYESSKETFLGQSLKQNQGVAAFMEWNGGLKLSKGLEVKSALTLGSKDQMVKVNLSFEQ